MIYFQKIDRTQIFKFVRPGCNQTLDIWLHLSYQASFSSHTRELP